MLLLHKYDDNFVIIYLEALWHPFSNENGQIWNINISDHKLISATEWQVYGYKEVTLSMWRAG